MKSYLNFSRLPGWKTHSSGFCTEAEGEQNAYQKTHISEFFGAVEGAAHHDHGRGGNHGILFPGTVVPV